MVEQTVNIREAHLGFLRLLAQGSGLEEAKLCRQIVDFAIASRGAGEGEAAPDLPLEAMPLGASKRALRRLQREIAAGKGSWSSLTVVLSEAQLETLQLQARAERSSISQVVRHHVADYLDHRLAQWQGRGTALGVGPQFHAVWLYGVAALVLLGVAAALWFTLLVPGNDATAEPEADNTQEEMKEDVLRLRSNWRRIATE